MQYVKKYARLIMNIIVPFIIVWFICIYGLKLLLFFMPFVVAWIIALIANPPVRWLDSKLKIKRKHSSFIIIVLVLTVVILAIYFLGRWAVVETSYFITTLPQIFSDLMEDINVAGNRLSRFYTVLPQSTRETIANTLNNMGLYVSDFIQSLATPTAQMAGGVVKSIPAALVYTVITILASYIMIADRDKISAYWVKHAPKSIRKYTGYAKKDINQAIGGYFKAQFRIMFVVAIVLAVGLGLLRVRYFVLIAILIAILDFLPVFGTGAILWPWALLKLLSGEYFFAGALMVIWIATQVLRQIIQPKIVGDSLGLSPLFTLVCLFLGFKWKGIGGMIVAVPIGMIALKLYRYGLFDSFISSVKTLISDIIGFMQGKKIDP